MLAGQQVSRTRSESSLRRKPVNRRGGRIHVFGIWLVRNSGLENGLSRGSPGLSGWLLLARGVEALCVKITQNKCKVGDLAVRNPRQQTRAHFRKSRVLTDLQRYGNSPLLPRVTFGVGISRRYSCVIFALFWAISRVFSAVKACNRRLIHARHGTNCCCLLGSVRFSAPPSHANGASRVAMASMAVRSAKFQSGGRPGDWWDIAGALALIK